MSIVVLCIVAVGLYGMIGLLEKFLVKKERLES